jgi:hypothetical protein
MRCPQRPSQVFRVHGVQTCEDTEFKVNILRVMYVSSREFNFLKIFLISRGDNLSSHPFTYYPWSLSLPLSVASVAVFYRNSSVAALCSAGWAGTFPFSSST